MTPLRDIIAAMSHTAKSELVALGFRKRTGEVFTLDLGDDALGWLGLHRSTYNNRGPLDVIPVIGIRDQAVEHLVADLLDERRHAYNPPTVLTPIGYLMPEQTYLAWRVPSLAEVPGRVRAMVEAIQTYGITFMQANASREALMAIMRSRPESERYFYRLPVALWLSGQPHEAAVELARAKAQMDQRTDAAAERYRRFAEAAARRLSG
jgi:hypothetical protein